MIHEGEEVLTCVMLRLRAALAPSSVCMTTYALQLPPEHSRKRQQGHTIARRAASRVGWTWKHLGALQR